MQIYVVKSGDTLYQIAKTFSTTANTIATANEIPDPNRLVIGQALVIPIEGMYYFVQSGDSFWLIGKKFGIDYEELAKINNIDPNNILQIGTRLYIPPLQKSQAEINAYVIPKKGSTFLQKEINRAIPYLTYIAPFSYQVQSDGSLSELNIDETKDIAKANGTNLMMVISNISNNGFDENLARDILANKETQDKLIDNIIAKANEVGTFSDVHFDFEFLPVDLKDEYSSFLKKAREILNKENLLVSAALAPKTSADQKGQWYEAHDYKAVGQAVDFVVIMTYEWGYSGGPPLPVSPIIPVEKVLNYAISEIPPEKILMGQNLYGYDWKLPYVAGKEFAMALSPQAAIELAKKYNQEIKYNYSSQAPYINYWDMNKIEHIVWFEDARSIQAKINLAKKLGIRGISYWRIGFPFPQNWLLVGANFDVIKK